jgi:acetyl-CoA C-acetyltransferase
MVERLRARPGDVGLATALGWYITKHAVGVYGSAPPPSGQFRRADTGHAQEAIDATALPPPERLAEGRCTVESYTVHCGKDGAPFGVPIVARLDNGRRAVAMATGDWAPYTEREVVGERGRLRAAQDVSRYEPVGS